MNPIYQFKLSINGDTAQVVRPLWNDLTKEWQKESGFAFFRATLSGRLTFQNADYSLIRNSGLDDLFDLEISISYDNGTTWSNYWNGYFYKTDCNIDENNHIVRVQAKAKDEYDAIINALDKEIDLIPASPQLVPVTYHKRPVVQFYMAGQAVIGCYQDGIYWEQQCDVVTDQYELNNTYKLGLLNSRTQVQTSGEINDFFWGNTTNDFDFDSTNYTFHREIAGTIVNFYITERGQTTKLYGASSNELTGTFILQAMSGSGMTGTVKAEVRQMDVYARLICDVTEYVGVQTEVLPDDDITDTTYHYSVALNQASYGGMIVFSSYLTSTPTQWGIFQPNQYYNRVGDNDIPMARSGWGRLSIWINTTWLSVYSPNMFEEGAKDITNNDCYPIESVLNTMFSKLGLSLSFQPTSDYSQFFYGNTTTSQGVPIKNVDYRLFICQKSNILKGQYDQPAQKAIVTLRQIFEMFEKCFKCYWFIDNGKLRIEHIYYFKNGGSYSGTPVVGRDLTSEIVTRNNKPLSYAQKAYTYDKPGTVGQYQFGWMDDVTIPFKGEPITIVSPYVNQESVESVDVSQFTSDIDYMQVAPSECSKDGFALFGCIAEEETISVYLLKQLDEKLNAGDIITSIGSASSVILYPYMDTSEYVTLYQSMLPYKLQDQVSMIAYTGSTNIVVDRYGTPTVPYVQDGNYKLQNGYLSFWYLQRYYDWDMPASSYRIGEADSQIARGIRRLKTQDVSFVALTDPDMQKLVKTSIGNGQFEKLSINLSSRNGKATLKYYPE